MDKDTKKLMKALGDQGFTVKPTKKGHLMVYKGKLWIATFSGTPSDWRSLANALSALKRAGFRWPPDR